MLYYFNSMRLFIGIPIPDHVQQSLLRLGGGLERVRWQRADQLHLTLHFLGEVHPERLDKLRSVVQSLDWNPMLIHVNDFGSFGKPVRILWAGVHPDAALIEQHSHLGKALQECGFAVESRDYRPHITLARIDRHLDDQQVAHWLEASLRACPNAMTFIAGRPVLFESIQGAMGSEYREIYGEQNGIQ
jgi:2'-5' RNA ligase